MFGVEEYVHQEQRALEIKSSIKASNGKEEQQPPGITPKPALRSLAGPGSFLQESCVSQQRAELYVVVAGSGLRLSSGNMIRLELMLIMNTLTVAMKRNPFLS